MDLVISFSRFAFLFLLTLFLLEILRILNRDIRHESKPRQSSPEPEFFLKVVSTGNPSHSLEGRVFKIGSRFTLGRDENCDLSFQDPFISGNHFLIEREGGVCHITDLDSRNGTIVEKKQIPGGKRIALNPPSVISVGQLILQFTAGEESRR